MKTVAVILARGGSKGVPRKNIKELGGKPLIAHAITAAHSSQYIEEVYVSTDDEEIASIAEKYGAKVIMRPYCLADDTASSESALLHFVEHVDFETLVFLQCTSPFTLPKDIDGAVEKYMKGHDSVLSVCVDHGGFLCGGFQWNDRGESVGYDYKNRPLRQNTGLMFRENGALYVMGKKGFLENKNRLYGNIGLYVMPRTRSFEIDEPQDFDIAEWFIKSDLWKK